jgi:hypothetical protein
MGIQLGKGKPSLTEAETPASVGEPQTTKVAI